MPNNVVLAEIPFANSSQSKEDSNSIDNLVLANTPLNSEPRNQRTDSNFNDVSFSNNLEFIEIPLATTETKTSLQIKLLKTQIECTKRDIYHRELLIFEKEQSLHISDDDRNRLLENSDAVFPQRKTV